MAERQQNPTFVPLYRQVKDIVISRIARGDWRPGEALPAEPKLGQELGVSAGTVRKALDELTAEKLLVRQQGRGTFVATQTPDSSLFHFFRLVDANGDRVIPTSRELERGHGPATAEERRRLGLRAGAKVMRLHRLRAARDANVMIERIVVPLRLFPDLHRFEGELPNTLYDLYQRAFGKTVRRVSERLRVGTLDGAQEASLLGLPSGASVLEIDRIAYTFDDAPVEWRLSKVDTRLFFYINEIL